jgi:hypothetical protein
VYHPFPDSNAHWTESTYALLGGGPCVVYNDYTLFISGDTVIGANTYHKLLRSGYIHSNCPPPGYYYYNQYAGAFRQDTAQRKVFVPSNNGDTLLYDFSLNVGDTLPQTDNYCTGGLVKAIDSVLVGNQYHKRFLLELFADPIGPHVLIEGVGSSFGLYNPMCPPFESASYLNCFNYSGNKYPANSNCTFATGISKPNNQTNSFTVFPNPFSTQTTLQTVEGLQNASMTVYNSVGQTVRHVDGLVGQTVTFYRDNLPSGLYFVRISQDGKTFSADKFVITDR